MVPGHPSSFLAYNSALPSNMSYQEYYKDYWARRHRQRLRNKYYKRRYGKRRYWFLEQASKKTLDVAGGNGAVLNYFNIENGIVMDVSDSGLSFAKSEFGYEAIKAEVHNGFPIHSSSFEAALLFEILAHITTANAEACLSEIHRILKKHGVLYISQPTCPPDGEHHLTQYFLSPLRQLLHKSGFIIEKLEFVPVFAYKEQFLQLILRHKFQPMRCLFWAACLLLSLLPIGLWEYLCSKFPNTRLVSLYIIRAKKLL